jgi:Ser/Thr protein kinase RdoA (MazF antagonist)
VVDEGRPRSAALDRLRAVRQRTFERSGIDSLGAHLEAHDGVAVTKATPLDVGVYRVDRADGSTRVARVFPQGRSVEAAAGEAVLLRFLADAGFPAERCVDAEPVSVLAGQPVLVTEYVEAGPPEQRLAAIRQAGGLHRLGVLLGRLQTLPGSAETVTWPGGCWHGLGVDGTAGDEIETVAALLADAEGLVAPGERPLYDRVVREVHDLEGGDGLPVALVHPDFVLPNVIASPDRGLVLIDWTGAGSGPRVWPLGFLLFATGALLMDRVDAVAAGYRHHVTLEPEELSILGPMVRARPILLEAWSFCLERKPLGQAHQSIAAARMLADVVTARATDAFTA